jgi:hypothetical protein
VTASGTWLTRCLGNSPGDGPVGVLVPHADGGDRYVWPSVVEAVGRASHGVPLSWQMRTQDLQALVPVGHYRSMPRGRLLRRSFGSGPSRLFQICW